MSSIYVDNYYQEVDRLFPEFFIAKRGNIKIDIIQIKWNDNIDKLEKVRSSVFLI